MNQGIKVADLFATLGLDASGLEKGLADSQIKMAEFATALERYQRGVFQKMDTPFLAASAAAQRYGDSINAAKAHLEDYFRVENSREQIRRAQAEYGGRQIIPFGSPDVVKDAMAKAELRAESDLAERIFQRDMDFNRRLRAETRDRIREQRFLRQQEDTSQLTAARNRQFQRGGGANMQDMFSTWSGIQVLESAIGIRIPMGFSMMMARLGPLQDAMNAAFAPLLIIGFIQALSQVLPKLQELQTAFLDLGEANQQFWSKAQERSLSAVVALERYNMQIDRAESLDETGEDKRGGTAARIARRRISIKERIDERAEVLESARKDLGRLGVAETGQAATIMQQLNALAYRVPLYNQISGVPSSVQVAGQSQPAGAAAKLQETIEKESKTIEELTDLLKQLQIEEKQNQNRRYNERNQLKRRDEVHELPWRMPWFMGPFPEDAFAASIAGAPGASRQPTLPGRNVRPPTGAMSRLMGRNTASTAAPTPSVPVDSSGISVIFSPTYAPVLNMDGVPADIQNFMRDKVEPILLQDLDNNARAFFTDFKRILSRKGFVTNG